MIIRRTNTSSEFSPDTTNRNDTPLVWIKTKQELRECLDELPAAIVELKALTTLNLRGCSSLERLPDGIDGREGLNVNLPLQMDNIPAPLAEDFAALRKLRDESEALKEYFVNGNSKDPREWKRYDGNNIVAVQDGRVIELSLQSCTELTTLPPAIGELGWLSSERVRKVLSSC